MLSKVTHLHLLFLRQPKGSMRDLGERVGNLFQMPRMGFFFSLWILLFLKFCLVVCTVSEYRSASIE